MADLGDTIEQAAQEPRKAKADNQEAEEHPLPDLIEADQHLQRNQGVAKPHRGLRFTRLIPPGGNG